MELGEKGGLSCQVVAPDVPSPKGSWSLAAGFGMRGLRSSVPRGGSSHKSRRRRRGKGYSWFRCGLLATPIKYQFAYLSSTLGLLMALPEVGARALPSRLQFRGLHLPGAGEAPGERPRPGQR